MSNSYQRLICGLIRSMARLSIRRLGIRSCCAPGKAGRLERIESNGLLFGVIPDPECPVRELARSVQVTGFCFIQMDWTSRRKAVENPLANGSSKNCFASIHSVHQPDHWS